MQKRKNNTQEWANRLISISFATLLSIGLQGCQDGVSTQSVPQTTGSAESVYKGPPARTDDIQNFYISVWSNLYTEDEGCGGCHGTGGTAPSSFVRADDINLAYEAVNPLVNRVQPDQSQLVTKFTGGSSHYCWLPDDNACAEIITRYIQNWVNTGTGAGREIQLTPPPDHEVGNSLQFPPASEFLTSVYPLLREHCVNCHNSAAAGPQSPYFAEAKIDVAYAAVKNSIDLVVTSNSQLVQRLRNLHNCWGDCTANANEMKTAIDILAGNAIEVPVADDWLASSALSLEEPDAIVASGGSRHESDLIALYEFKTGSGTTALDTSGVNPRIDLTLSGDVSWVKGWGLEFTGNGKAQGTTTASSKLSQLIKATGEYSIEAWLVPANVTQEGPARIVSYSAGTNLRNFTLGQSMYNYDFMQRSDTTDGNGEPALSTADDDERVQASEQHVVVTFDPVKGRRIYVNGVFTGDLDTTTPEKLNNWDNTYALVLGNEASSDYPWEGKIRLLAIHNRALTQGQIKQNFDAGVGEKFFLLFNITHLITRPICDPIQIENPDDPEGPLIESTPKNYIMFEASQFDNDSYMFREPRYICLDGAVNPNATPIPLAGMRIGISDGTSYKVSSMGQGFVNLDTTLGGSEYTPNGQKLVGEVPADEVPNEETPIREAAVATTIPMGGNRDITDQFFLTFDTLDEGHMPYIEPEPPEPPALADREPASRIGLRTFEEINASMSALTGVPRTNDAVTATYGNVRQQLPSSEDINGFLSSHQVAISQLAIEYCSELVDNRGSIGRDQFFPDFPFTTNANDITDPDIWQNRVVTPIIDHFLGQNIATQPTAEDVRTDLQNLLIVGTDNNPGGLANCGSPCASTERTAIAVKAACASVLGSAAILLQ